MKRRCDLHLHSYYSDGAVAPAALSLLLKEKNLEYVSLTDHDTVAGVEQMNEACRQYGIINIAGAEFSAFDGANELHILGYGINYNSSALTAVFDALKISRERRAEMILKKLAVYGLEIAMEDVLRFSRLMVSRSHIASAVAAKYGLGNSKAVFDKYLSEGKCCFVPNRDRSPAEVIELIHNIGGLAVLAHPYRIKADDSTRLQIIYRLKDFGLDGLEVYYKSYKTSVMASTADKLGLIMTGGSDFHNLTDKMYVKTLPQKLIDKLIRT